MFKNIVIVFAFLFLFTVFTAPVLAYEVTDFGSCLNPQVAASQVNVGSDHGVVGYPNTAFSGMDSIYSISEGNMMQCLCTDNGNGYQTVWLRASNYSQLEVSQFTNEGWSYYADAGLWGLNGSYLAKTAKYLCMGVTPTPRPSCTPTPTPTGAVIPTPTPGPTSTPTPGPTNTPTPGPTAIPTPGTSANTTLASTGNVVLVYSVFAAGILFLLVGLSLKKFGK